MQVRNLRYGVHLSILLPPFGCSLMGLNRMFAFLRTEVVLNKRTNERGYGLLVRGTLLVAALEV